MDKYLELMQKQEELLASLKAKIACKEYESRQFHKIIETDESKKKDNLQEQAKVIKNIAVLKKYDGKNVIWQNIKDFYKFNYEQIKRYQGDIAELLVCIFVLILLHVGFMLISPILFPLPVILLGLIFTIFAIYNFSFERKKLKELRKSTSIESEKQKLEDLEKERKMIKYIVRANKGKKSILQKEINDLYNQKEIVESDILAIQQLRKDSVAKLVTTTKLDEEYFNDEEIARILKRKKGEDE